MTAENKQAKPGLSFWSYTQELLFSRHFICCVNFLFSPNYQVPIHVTKTLFLMGLITKCFFCYLTNTQPRHKALMVNRTNRFFFFSILTGPVIKQSERLDLCFFSCIKTFPLAPLSYLSVYLFIFLSCCLRCQRCQDSSGNCSSNLFTRHLAF